MRVSINTQSVNKKIGNFPVGEGFKYLTQGKYWKSVEITIQQLAEHIAKGHAWMPTLIDWLDDYNLKDRNAANCNNAYALAIDVDNTDYLRDETGKLIFKLDENGELPIGEDGKPIKEKIKIYSEDLTIDQALEHPFIKQHCALAMPSPSHTDDWHKFRLVFVLNEALTSSVQIKQAYQYLMSLLPCADPACKNSDRIFYGAKDAKPFLINPDALVPTDFSQRIFEFQAELEATAKRKADRANKFIDFKDPQNEERRVLSALDAIPSRTSKGSSTYLAVRDCIWALCDEYGNDRAIAIMEQHSPSNKAEAWSVEAIANKYDPARSKTLATIFWYAKQYGWSDPYKRFTTQTISTAKLAIQTAIAPVIQTKVRFKINLSNLCSLPSRRVFQGTSTLVTMSSLMTVYRELREWEQSLGLIAPDTKVISSPRKIIDKIAERWQIDDNEIDEAITELGEIKTRIGSNDDRIDMLRLYRTKIIEGYDTQEEIDKAEKQEYFYMCERVVAWFRTNLLFNQQIEMWHRYVNGVWKVATDKEIKAEARQLLTDLGMSDSWLKGAKVSDDKVTNFVKEIQSAVLIERLDAVKEYKHLINMQDGVLNRRTKRLLPHDRKYMFSWQLPYKWEDRHLGAAIIQDWLQWTFEHEDQIKLLKCWLNATICERSDIQKVLQLVGAGGAGKSTFSKLAMALIGVSNVHQTSIELMDTQFEPSNFLGKQLIAISEIGEYRGSGTTLKKVTGRDRIPNQIKFQQARNSGFTYKGQLIIIANKEFAPHDSGSSFDRRNICVPFNKVIANSKKRNLIEIDDDGSVSGEFAACLPAFLEMVLDLTDKEVTNFLEETNVYVPSLNDAATNSILNGDTLAQWVEDNLVAVEGLKTYVGKAELVRVTELVNGKSITKNIYAKAETHLFANYIRYCAENGAKDKDSVNMQNFSRRLLDLFSGTLRNSFVKKAIRDKDGCAILGLTIRTPEHAHMPTPIKNVMLNEATMKGSMNIETLANENLSNNVGDFQPLPASSSNTSLITTTPLPIEEEVHYIQDFHSVGVELSSTVTDDVHFTKGDKVKISIPLELFSDPDIINALEKGDIPPLDKTYTVDEIYMIDGFTYIGFDGREGRVFEEYVEKVES
jgi:phage/plasmid-associated DNA primase